MLVEAMTNIENFRVYQKDFKKIPMTGSELPKPRKKRRETKRILVDSALLEAINLISYPYL